MIIIPNLQKKKLRKRDVKYFVQGHKAKKMQGWNANLYSLASKSRTFP